MDVDEIFGAIIALVFVVILGYAFTPVFLALPGGLWWAVFFVLLMIGVGVAVMAAIFRAFND
jgi:hypothetical protein